MTYDDVKRQQADKIQHELPWPSLPGDFVFSCSRADGPMGRRFGASSMNDAIVRIRIAYRDKWKGFPAKIVRADGTEIWLGVI